MQSTAALESEIWEVMVYGPGHHRGTNGTDEPARELLAPLADLIDRKNVLERYWLVLHLLKKDPLDRGLREWENAALVVGLRNELVHYKSRWGEELSRSKLLKALEAKGHQKPPFIGSTSYFPFRCLSAACAAWAVESCVAFLDAFYTNLGFPERLNTVREWLRRSTSDE
jgi:hypothetical protein